MILLPFHYKQVPQDPSALRKNIYFCPSCNQYLPSTQFALSSNSRTVGKCQKCTKIDNDARTRQDYSTYTHMLRQLRKSEERYGDDSKIAFLLQVKQLCKISYHIFVYSVKYRFLWHRIRFWQAKTSPFLHDITILYDVIRQCSKAGTYWVHGGMSLTRHWSISFIIYFHAVDYRSKIYVTLWRRSGQRRVSWARGKTSLTWRWWGGTSTRSGRHGTVSCSPRMRLPRTRNWWISRRYDRFCIFGAFTYSKFWLSIAFSSISAIQCLNLGFQFL